MNDLKISETFQTQVAPKIDKNTRTVITAWMNHNGECEVFMSGQDIDMAWILKLIELRFQSVINSKLVGPKVIK